MASVDAATRQAWRERPDEMVGLILRVEGDVMERAAALEERGVQVRRRYKLTNSISVRCSARVALALLRLGWIQRVEPDRPMRAL
ncbi:MAG: hypothetical protein V1772_03895 [Chloroflexota bacterium]